jgi:outer membrane murein-binding lipoprotein Lpp
MKHAYLILVLLMIVLSSCSQFNGELDSKLSDLTAKVDSLSAKVDELTEQNQLLDQEISWLENEIVDLDHLKKSKLAEPVPSTTAKTPEKSVQDGQCKALTTSGSRCSRVAQKGSEYCWQHIKTYEPDRPAAKDKATGSVSVSSDSGSYTIYTGPKGGKYYINSSGKKIYIKK